MKLVAIMGVLLGIVALVVAALIFRRWKNGRPHETRGRPVGQGAAGSEVQPVAQEAAAALPSEIHIGSEAQSPAVKVRPLPVADVDVVRRAPAVKPSLGVASRISGLMQAAPSLLVAQAHRGRQLMEVVIDGKLIRAADGEGFRAMAMGSKGIKEHARLFEVGNLSNLVNVAAVWQLASVVVAQKHMADISQKLGEIKDAVDSISDFLDSGRRAVIHGTYQYLQQGYEALAQGELTPAIRGELESCERELLAVQHHLLADIKRRAQLAPRDDDTFGTESLHKNSLSKYHELGQVVDDLKVCVQTRALAWYVLSLYPGEQALKAARRDSIRQGLDELTGLESLVAAQGSVDMDRFKSMWNRGETLSVRRGQVRDESGAVQSLLTSTRTGTAEQLATSQTLLIERDRPTSLIVELIDGQVKDVWERELVAG